MKTQSILFLLLAFSLTLSASAQQTRATAGRYGVFIQTDRLLHGPRYILERLETGNGQAGWKSVYMTDEAPRSATDLIARLTLLTRKNPLYQLPNDSLTRLLYARYRDMATADSLNSYGWNPQYLEAFGIGFLDTAVVQGRRYDYRIRPMTNTGDGPSRSPVTVSVPGAKPAVTAKSLRHSADGSAVKITYLLQKSTPDLAGVRILRATYGQTAFTECGADWGFRKGKKDSVLLEITDSQVRRKMLYQYVVLITDFLGNESRPSDTLTLTNLRPNEQIPAILDIRTTSAEANNAIRLSWRLASTKDLRSIEIWRSDNYDNSFRRIASALPTDTVFYDNRVEPVKGYYYQLRPNGTYDALPASVKVSGMLQANRSALVPPSFLRLAQADDTLTFRWQRADVDTRGYYLYFSNSPSGPMTQYSSVIISTDSVIQYKVPVSKLALGVGYRWSVTAVNTSYNQSPMSQVVYSDPRFPARLATPINPAIVQKEDHALVIWENMQTIDPYVIGYLIERQEEEGAFKELYRQLPTDRARNSYEDGSVQLGRHYNYRIRAYGLNDKFSAFSTEVTYFVPLPPVLPLRGLVAVVTGKGVKVGWDAPLDNSLDKVLIYRYTPKTDRPRLVGTVPGRQTEFIDREATPGIAYQYTLVAVQPDKRESDSTSPVGVEWR
ncbi:hypothetical protein GO755_11685 [Spirosoma sp. HMF4905]|uniref:Fibronectin type-III domain-containing protein n=1 Tax=Spirosoma arboris TaxID=2682092 RepID=A0A7K1SA44_9BACT|nr:hypothetical protein [Spirosoma arboris]MVM30694.1 hypothetical protein [Spirosoma arboris]